MYVILAIILVLIIIGLPTINSQLMGGSREAIFSRFKYLPQFPFISRMDTKNLDVFSKEYTARGPLTFISGRPYNLYDTKASTWIYPWYFPQEINMKCAEHAAKRCNEPIIMIKREEDKLSGLAAPNPKDIVRVSDCYRNVYENCSM
jgi:hypothetical protein